MATSRARKAPYEPPPNVPRRTTLRRARCLLANYDPDLSHVDLVADDALDDLAVPRASLLKAICPKIYTMRVLSTTPGGAGAKVTKFVVTPGKGEGCVVVTIGPAEWIRMISDNLQEVRHAALNSSRVVAESCPPLYEGGYGALALRGVTVGGDLAPTFLDELKVSLGDSSTPGRSLVPLPRQIWQRGAPLHELAVETATRDETRPFVGPSGWAKEQLDALLDKIKSMLPARVSIPRSAPDDAIATAEDAPAADDAPATANATSDAQPIDIADEEETAAEDEGDDVAEPTAYDLAVAARAAFLSRSSPALLSTLDELHLPEASWAGSGDAFARGLFASCPDEMLGDAAWAPLVDCLRELRDLASPTWHNRCPLLPPWVGGYVPLCVRVHGDLRGSNILVDHPERKMSLIGFGERMLAPVFYDVARLIAHSLVAGIRLDKARGSSGGADASLPASPAGGGEQVPVELSKATEKRLDMLCSCIDVLFPISSGSCCHDSLLVLSALPIADVVPEGTAEDIKAAILISQQMIDGACRTTLAAAAGLKDTTGRACGMIDEHDLHPISLLLPLLTHALDLCASSELSHAQQRAAWHLARRVATLVSGFVTSGAAGGVAGGTAGDAAAARELAAAQRQLEEVRREADGALQFQKVLVERLTRELEQARVAANSSKGVAKAAAEAGKAGEAGETGETAPSMKAPAPAKTNRTPSKGDGKKTKREGGAGAKRADKNFAVA